MAELADALGSGPNVRKDVGVRIPASAFLKSCVNLDLTFKEKRMKNFKSGTYISQETYKSFQPEKINKKWNFDNMEMLNLLSQADRQLGRLDMYSEYIPNIDLFISMHVLKEANSIE